MTQGDKPVLAVDVDDVLYPLVPLYAKYHNEHHGTSLTPADFNEYIFENVTKVSPEEYAKRFRHFGSLGGFEEQRFVESSQAAVEQLSGQYQLVVITSRWPDWEQETIGWLKRYFPETFRKVHFANSYTQRDRNVTKADICQDIGAQILIDDSLSTLTDCASKGIRGLLFGDYAWNKASQLPSGVQRVQNWNEVVEALL